MKKILVAAFWIALVWAGFDFALAWKARSDFSSQVSAFLAREQDDSRAARSHRESRGTTTESEIIALAGEHKLDLYYEDIRREGGRLYVTVGQTIFFREFIFTLEI
jgi:hypothetical protein